MVVINHLLTGMILQVGTYNTNFQTRFLIFQPVRGDELTKSLTTTIFQRLWMFQRGCMIYIYIYLSVRTCLKFYYQGALLHISMFNFTFVLKADACMYAYIIWMIFFALQRVPRIFADVKTGAACHPSCYCTKFRYSYWWEAINKIGLPWLDEEASIVSNYFDQLVWFYFVLPFFF